MTRPDFIRHWQELEDDGNDTDEGDNERFSFGAPLGRALGLTRIGIHHERLPPGRRSTYPHAESQEEEFVYVLAGNPDVWLNGELYPLSPGDAVGLPAGTGICHTFINNTAGDVRLLVVGEADKPENRIRYPMNPEYEARRADRWLNYPDLPFGEHDGKPAVPRP